VRYDSFVIGGARGTRVPLSFFPLVSLLIARPEESGDPRDDGARGNVIHYVDVASRYLLPIIAAAARCVYYVHVINAGARPRAWRSEEIFDTSIEYINGCCGPSNRSHRRSVRAEMLSNDAASRVPVNASSIRDASCLNA
jgi:hypothetical protein